jgi:Protein of unknown function (DUF4238)
LAYEVEDPVNQFITDFCDPLFVMTEQQQRRMTRYVTLLFNRSVARRNATKHLLEMRNGALNSFLANQTQLITVSAHWNIDAYFRGLTFGRLITTDDVARAARRYLSKNPSDREVQEWYAQGTLRAIAGFDEDLFRGLWSLIPSRAGEVFVLSDAPVVTWNRSPAGALTYGVGFHTANVEVILPISPGTCLHILPQTQRSRAVVTPTATEINVAQASFAHNACFANQNSDAVDDIVQEHISTVRLGQNAFTVFHKNYENAIYDILMGRGR